MPELKGPEWELGIPALSQAAFEGGGKMAGRLWWWEEVALGLWNIPGWWTGWGLLISQVSDARSGAPGTR